ncbi:hypothetical protein GALL_385460 [mine drainage metagenome]|uniref:Uncharacterized protein n=1 Tax=mine drainage metagenome TaxID=410659 RepID=A0A1J5QIC0_9ZZZZ
MALRHEQADPVARGLSVVHRDTRVRGTVVVDQLIRHARAPQAAQHGMAGGFGHGQDQSIDPLGQQGIDGVGLASGVVAGGHQQHAVAAGRRRFLDALHAFAEHGVEDVGQDDADEMGPFAAQLAPEQVRPEAQGLHRGQNALACGRPDLGGFVQGPRHGGDGSASQLGDVVDGAGDHVDSHSEITRQWRWRATCASTGSGSTATGWRTASSRGRSLCESL